MRPRPECEPMARGWGDSVAGFRREGADRAGWARETASRGSANRWQP